MSRWTFEEESTLLKSIASGKTYKELSGGFNRSENALELRVKKIVYENISNNKPADKISKLLNMSTDQIMQYYYSYKDHLERESKLKGGNINEKKDSNNGLSNNGLNNNSKIDVLENNMRQINEKKPATNMTGGNTNNKIEKLENQNRKMKLMLENYMLKQRLTKILKSKDKHIYNDLIKKLVQ